MKLSKRIRLFLAQKLWPDAFVELRQFQFEYARLRDAYWWMGEFPESAATLRWILDNHQDWTRPTDQPPPERAHYWRQGIADFREQLRRGEHLNVFCRSALEAIGEKE